MSKLFLWRSLDKWRAGGMPAGATVAIGIADRIDVHGDVLISAQLMSDGEVDEAIDNLVAELEELRRKAKTFIRSNNAKVVADVSKRNSECPKFS
ncbi:hypothetical protein GCM10025794_01370 [Massilia kyonggiensis]|nr:hypothetical protein [Massilia kyonggiensis]